MPRIDVQVRSIWKTRSGTEASLPEMRWESQWGDVDWGFGGNSERTPAPSVAAWASNGASDPWKSGW